jgi:hypothetical protein
LARCRTLLGEVVTTPGQPFRGLLPANPLACALGQASHPRLRQPTDQGFAQPQHAGGAADQRFICCSALATSVTSAGPL